MEIVARIGEKEEGKDGKEHAASVSVNVDLGGNLDEAVSLVGEEPVFVHYIRAVVIAARGVMVGMKKAGKTVDEIVAFMATWQPGVSRRAVADPKASMIKKFLNMSDEEQSKMIAELTAMKE